MKREKIKLASLQVKSFVTDLGATNTNTLKGGTSTDKTPPTTRDSNAYIGCQELTVVTQNLCI